MTSPPPHVQGNTLTYQQSGQAAHVLVDTPDWYVCLSTVSTFTFHSEHGTFTARKEQAGSRRGGEYTLHRILEAIRLTKHTSKK